MTSPTDQALRWVGGAYFSHYRQHSTESTNSAAFADAIGQTTGPNLYSFDQSVIDQQTAVFVDLTYKIMPRLEITAGERYYELRDSLENTTERRARRTQSAIGTCKGQRQQSSAGADVSPGRRHHRLCDGGARLPAGRSQCRTSHGNRLYAEQRLFAALSAGHRVELRAGYEDWSFWTASYRLT